MRRLCVGLSWLMCVGVVLGDNPLVTHIFTADPTARVFDGVLYVYPSHDIPEFGGVEGSGGFMMEDYHVFSTTDLMNYEDHGVALHQDDIGWGTANYTMWAPDCNVKNGTYYFYFPMNFKVGVATSSSPTGPFVPEPAPIPNANKIDPCLFLDDDGTPYLYFGGGQNDSLRVMRMKDDMLTPDMSPKTLTGLGAAYKEGSFMFKRGGIYYFTYPYAPDGSEEIHYATGTSPLGPFTPRGTVIDRWTDGCWTDHHSMVQYNGRWYLFYHHMDLSGDKTLRSMCADELFFNADGTIQKVIPTRRGIGVRGAGELIQVDRYLDGSGGLATPVFPGGETRGFYLSGIDAGNWIHYPDVDFGTNGFAAVAARVRSAGAGTIEVRDGGTSGPLLGEIQVGPTVDWETGSVALTVAGKAATGTKDLYLVFNGAGSDLFEVDWIQFTRSSQARIYFAGDGVGEVVVNGSRTIKSFHNTAGLDAPLAVTLSATAAAGSRFAGWQLNGVATNGVASLEAGDALVAVFMQDYPVLDGLARLEAETYTEQTGVQKVTGENAVNNGAVGYVENGDLLVFRNVDFKLGVDYLKARVASEASGGKIVLCLDRADAVPLCELTIPATGSWNTWETVEERFSRVAGVHDVFFKFEGGSGYLFNVDWFDFGGTIPAFEVIEAEDFSSQSGIQIEPCSDEGGGENVGYVENGDALTFEDVSFPGSATSFVVRVSSGSGGGILSVHLDDPNTPAIATMNIAGTGNWSGWNQWFSQSVPVNIPAGLHHVYLKFSGAGTGYLFNLNWLRLEGTTGYTSWLNDNGVTTLLAKDEDCDFDGVANLIEYALDLNPSAPSSLMETVNLSPEEISASYIQKPDVYVRLFYSTDLDAWLEVPPVTTPVGYPAGSVFYLFDTNAAKGFFYWRVDSV